MKTRLSLEKMGQKKINLWFLIKLLIDLHGEEEYFRPASKHPKNTKDYEMKKLMPQADH